MSAENASVKDSFVNPFGSCCGNGLMAPAQTCWQLVCNIINIQTLFVNVSMGIICCLQKACLQIWNSWHSVACGVNRNPLQPLTRADLLNYRNSNRLLVNTAFLIIDHFSPLGLTSSQTALRSLCPILRSNLGWISITRVDPVLNCKANNNPVSHCLTQASCLSSHSVRRLFSPWLRQKWGEKMIQVWQAGVVFVTCASLFMLSRYGWALRVAAA